MLELENLAYVDLQKTGSTTIGSILKLMFRGHETRKEIHGPVPHNFDPKKLAFVSIREPLALCASLFTYGAAEKRGQLYATLMRNGYPGLYESSVRGFERWLDFFTDPVRAKTLYPRYARYSVHQDIGFLSFRLLYMSVPNAHRVIEKLERGKRNVKNLLARERVYSDYVRTENLAMDLFSFFKRHENELEFEYPLTTAQDMIARVPKKNASTKIEGVNAQSISQELRQRVIDREWLIYTEFGYKNNPTGLPSNQNPRFNAR